MLLECIYDFLIIALYRGEFFYIIGRNNGNFIGKVLEKRIF